jgi:D-serine deaminase-like pyridoxal phosphate-dependent protein
VFARDDRAHGGTSMAPQLLSHQLEDGAWAIALATPRLILPARDFGFFRIALANQLVGWQAKERTRRAQAPPR